MQLLVRGTAELLITAAALVFLYVAWQLWWTNIDAGAQQQDIVQSLSQEFGGPVSPAAPDADYGDPVVAEQPRYGAAIGILYIPRFGDGFSVPVSVGVGHDVLDNLGLGQYPDAAMPGEVGNFSVAGHRQTHGKALDLIHTLEPGDHIYVRTAEGYYDYVFRKHEIVTPDRVDVLLPVPKKPGAEPTERLLTMTSCHPRYGDEERIIAYSVLESWQPTSAGPPAAIAETVAKITEG
ncbi:class E sortase [Arthrobacter sp.]|uniref:class E sortase n=1 Tax=Arthrobacter sp. TaxID=1667 RepID=UPI00339A36DC